MVINAPYPNPRLDQVLVVDNAFTELLITDLVVTIFVHIEQTEDVRQFALQPLVKVLLVKLLNGNLDLFAVNETRSILIDQVKEVSGGLLGDCSLPIRSTLSDAL